MTDIERTCAFTGHRSEKLSISEEQVVAWLEDRIWDAVAYVSPRIDVERWLPKIKALFGIADDRYRVLVDHSAHYRCSLDDGWRQR